MLTVYWSHIVDEQRAANDRARRASLRTARAQRDAAEPSRSWLERLHLVRAHTPRTPRMRPLAH